MTRSCEWCDTPLPKDAHKLRRYCDSECIVLKNINRKLLVILLEMDFSDKSMYEFGFERVES